MDSSVWITIAGILGTLGGTFGGVWLGNYLQNRNMKRQREWNLQDQKREWTRKQRQEKFNRILEYVEGSLLYIFKGKLVLQIGSEKQKDELLFSYPEQYTHAITIIPDIINIDKELAELVKNFSFSFEGTDKIIKDGDIKISEKEQILMNIAGQIQRRITILLEETFD